MSVISKSLDFIKNHLSQQKSDLPFVVGFSGPQGSGKTYCSEAIASQLNSAGIKCVKFSMDDLYLTYQDQLEITKKALQDDNELLQGRGLPGTHDLKLCLQVLHDLKHFSGPVSIPIYDKSAYSGKGDRDLKFVIVDSKPNVVIFEGWFNGYVNLQPDQIRLRYFSTQGEGYVTKHPLYQIEELNSELNKYCEIWRQFDAFIYMASDYANVATWRLQQEHDLIAKTGDGMSDEMVLKFIERYMPMYELYYQNLKDYGCETIQDRPSLKLSINLKRELLD